MNFTTVLKYALNFSASSFVPLHTALLRFFTKLINLSKTIKNFAQSNVPPRSRRGIARQVSLVVNMRGLPMRSTKLPNGRTQFASTIN
nr:MAG TPA: hypothetical protein [Caudoviricetes sp.]